MVAEVVDDARRTLAEAGIGSAQIDAELLVGDVLELDRAGLRAHGHNEVSVTAINAIASSISRRAAHEPVQYILGRAPFRTVELEVDARVLVPRPETELLVDIALAEIKQIHSTYPPREVRVVDTCTGSGAVPIAIAIEADSEPLMVGGIDLSSDALEVARANAARLAPEVEFTEGNLLEPVAHGAIHIVTANPPYVLQSEIDSLPADVRDYEPRMALTLEGDDPTAIVSRLLEQARDVLVSGGLLAIEVGMGQAERVADSFTVRGWRDVTIHDDLQGIGRIVSGRNQ
jgi:release factor glutamine methyltransferase